MILLYYVSQLSIAGLSEEFWAESLDMVNKVIGVLAFCKELDPVASEFWTSLSAHYECFREETRQSSADAVDQAHDAHFMLPQPDDYLFTTTSGFTLLHNTSNQLFEQLCKPYANTRATTALREHVSSSQSPRTDLSESRSFSSGSQGRVSLGSDTARTAITPKTSNLEDGYFVDSNEPRWWVAKRSAATYSSGARTLKVL